MCYCYNLLKERAFYHPKILERIVKNKFLKLRIFSFIKISTCHFNFSPFILNQWEFHYEYIRHFSCCFSFAVEHPFLLLTSDPPFFNKKAFIQCSLFGGGMRELTIPWSQVWVWFGAGPAELPPSPDMTLDCQPPFLLLCG